MHLRPLNNNRPDNHRQGPHKNTSMKTSKQKQPHNHLTSLALSTASNNQLKQIIQNLISKSRSLITSLQTTLKQLQQVRQQKDFWKGHYFAFRTACEKCINSRGIAPFEYINELEKTVREWGFRREEEICGGDSQECGMGNLKEGQLGNLKVMSLANSRMRVDFRQHINDKNHCQQDWSKQSISGDKTVSNERDLIMNSMTKPQQPIQNTEAKTPTKPNPLLNSFSHIPPTTIQHPNTQSLHKSTLETSFTGIRLGHTNSKRKNSPQQNNDSHSKGLDKIFKRKDSIQTKRNEIFSFAHQKNNGSRNLNRTLEEKR